MAIVSYLYYFWIRMLRRMKMYLLRPLFRSFGKNFVFDPNGTFSFRTISVGNDVYIGPGACLIASASEIIIGNKVLFGPNVTIVGGDHNIEQIGRFMYDVKEKLPENDQPVTIEDDVWLGAGVIILKGTTIGRGSVVAAGALVTKNVPRYAIVAGVPARVVKMRFTVDGILAHEKALYPSDPQ